MSTCAVVAAAAFNEDHFRTLDAAGAFAFVVAVDGGFAHLERIGRAPDLAIGDFDSLGYVPKCRRVSRYPVEKDKSDLELALDRIRVRRYDEVVVYGALSGRLDHTIANLQLFAKMSEQGTYVTGIGEDFCVQLLTGPDVLDLPARESGIVSVFAATERAEGVIERGLKYEIADETLTNRSSRGLSNEFAGRDAAIGLESGTLYIFCPLPGAPDGEAAAPHDAADEASEGAAEPTSA